MIRLAWSEREENEMKMQMSPRSTSRKRLQDAFQTHDLYDLADDLMSGDAKRSDKGTPSSALFVESVVKR